MIYTAREFRLFPSVQALHTSHQSLGEKIGLLTELIAVLSISLAVPFLDREGDYRGESTFQITVLCVSCPPFPEITLGLRNPTTC